MENIYLITEKRLLELLTSKLILSCLKRDGVDNWEWYMGGKDRFLADALNLPIEQIVEMDYDFSDVAYQTLKNFQKLI